MKPYTKLLIFSGIGFLVGILLTYILYSPGRYIPWHPGDRGGLLDTITGKIYFPLSNGKIAITDVVNGTVEWKEIKKQKEEAKNEMAGKN
jgi:hypothetical protein